MLTQVVLYNQLFKKVDFLVKTLSLHKFVNRIGRKLALSLSNILSLALFRHQAQIATKKKLYELMRPNCSYKTLVVSINKYFTLGLQLLLLILKHNCQTAHLVKHLDATDVPVCSNNKAKSHKVMKRLAAWGKTGKGWFYGLKMHLISDLEGKLLALKFTSGNVDDRDIVVDLAKDLKGIFVADAGYISSELEKKFYQEKQRMILIKPRANMKKLATALDVFLYGTRMKIEINFRNLKQLFGLISPFARSEAGCLANYTYSLLAYALR